MMIRCLQVSLWALLWWGLSTCPSAVDAKKDRNKPQGHHGYLTPYKAGPFSTVLSKNDEKLLASGKPVMKQTMPSKDDPEAGGGALCVQDVDAPVAAVWNQILDLGSYKGKVPKIVASSNYVNKRNPDGTNNIKTRLVIGVMPGYAYESYYDHIYHPRESSMTWRLDYEKTSDFDDVSGHWHVEEHPTNPQASRVFYACDVKMKSAVPGPILNYLSKAALKQATGWVKKESEKKPDARPPGRVSRSRACRGRRMAQIK